MSRARNAGAALVLCTAAVLTYRQWPSSSLSEQAPDISPASSQRGAPSRRQTSWASSRAPLPRTKAPVAAPQPYSGRVTSTAGGGLPATVCATSEPADEAPPCRETQADGHYELTLAAGRIYTISAAAFGHSPQSRRWSGQEPAALDFALEPGGVSVRGRTVDATGGSIAGALVTARAGSAESLARCLSDAGGEFELHLGSGEIDLTATAPGYASAQAELVAPARGVELVLAPGSALVGTALRADTQEGVAGARVVVRPRNGLLVSAAPTRTGPDGTFRISGVTAGAYELRADAEGFASEPLFVRVEVASESESVRLQMQPAAQVSARLLVGDEPCRTGSVDLVGASAFRTRVESGLAHFPGVLPGRYRAHTFCESGGFGQFELEVPERGAVHPVWRTMAGHELRGRVVTASAQGASNRQIQCLPSHGTAEGLVSPAPPCLSDDNGDFVCRGLHEGRYSCVARTFDTASPPIEVALPSEAPIELALDALGRIRVDLGEPLAGAAVVATDERGLRRWAKSAGGAEFVLGGLPLGSYSVGTARYPEQARVTLARDGQTVELRLTAPAGELSGQVLDAAGAPVAEAWVQAQTPGSGAVPAPPVLTDDGGHFRFHPIAVGSYFVTVTSSLGEASAGDVQTGELRVITLQGYGAMAGSVTAADGQPVKEFELAYANGETLEVQRVSNGEGRWSVPWLPVGQWTVSVRAASGTAERAVEIEPALRRELHLTLSSRGPELNGTITPSVGADLSHRDPDNHGG